MRQEKLAIFQKDGGPAETLHAAAVQAEIILAAGFGLFMAGSDSKPGRGLLPLPTWFD